MNCSALCRVRLSQARVGGGTDLGIGRLEQRRHVDAAECLVPGETSITRGAVEFLNGVFKSLA
jgi:hypothetical protein